MQIPRPTDADKERFRGLVPAVPGVEVKPMFGNLGSFINGNMFAGLFGHTIGVKLADQDRDELLAAGAGPFGPPERPMSGYLSLPPAVLDQPSETAGWINRALEYVAALPAKPPKTKAARTSST